MTLVYPIDENGFVIWESERFAPKPDGYEPSEDEITIPIPPDNNGVAWYRVRWDGTHWVEGVDHPNAPIPNSMQLELGGQMT